MIKVSIIVPVFNTKKEYLDKCLNSLINQTLDDIEILLVDDASTDEKTINLLKEYSKNHKVKLFHHDINKKQGGARNTGLKESKGEYIAFVDSDDYLDLKTYELLYKNAKENQSDVVDSDVIYIDKNGKEIKKVKSCDSLDKNSLILRPGQFWTKIFRREMLIKNNILFPENMFFEDNAISSLHIIYANKVTKVDKYLYYYLQHDNATTSLENNHLDDRIKAGKIFYEIFNERGLFDKYPKQIKLKYFQVYFKSLYRLVMKYKKNYLVILKDILEDLEINGINIDDNIIQNNLTKKQKLEIKFLNEFPFLFKLYVDVKFNKYKK